MAVSVDPPQDAQGMATAFQFSFPLASDSDLSLIRRVGIENLEVEDLALHAVYIVDRGGKVVYRKVARRRPSPEELLAAIDFHFAPPPE